MTTPPTTPPPKEDLPVPIKLPDKGFIYVRTEAELARCVEDLARCSVLGVDTESDSFFSYREQCCLIQITGEDTIDYIIDPLQIDDLSALGPLMADPEVTKIFHGADYDVVSLKRDFGFKIHCIFDTMIAAQATSHDRFGLNDLVQRYFGEVLDKRWQRHDWSSRPLQDAQLDYARKDSHFLPALRELLLEQGEQASRLAMFEEEFVLLEQREWTGRPFDPNSCMRIKQATTLDPKARRVLRAVVSLREEIAHSKNRPPFKVWSNEACMKIAQAGPKSGKELRECLGDGNHIVRRYAREVLAASRGGLEDTSPPPETPKPPVRMNKAIPPFNRDDEPLLNALKRWRNKRCQSTGLGPGMVLNNAVLKDIAALKPRRAEQFLLLPDMRKWQRDESGEAVLEFVSEWLEKHPADAKPRSGRRRRRGGRRREAGAEQDRAKTETTKDE